MATPQLQAALEELTQAGAQGLPSVDEVEAFETTPEKKGRWSGTRENGAPWELIKNSPTSYNCVF